MLYCFLWRGRFLLVDFSQLFWIIITIVVYQVGDKLPNVDLFDGTPQNKVNLPKLVSGKKVVIVGEVGAFTPCCTKVYVTLTKLIIYIFNYPHFYLFIHQDPFA